MSRTASGRLAVRSTRPRVTRHTTDNLEFDAAEQTHKGTPATRPPVYKKAGGDWIRTQPKFVLALQLLSLGVSESMGNHDSEVVDAGSVD